jgi:hypothetical protein
MASGWEGVMTGLGGEGGGEEHRVAVAQDQLATHRRQKMRLAPARQTKR